MEFKIEIEEKLQRVVTVEADSLEEAIAQVDEAWSNSEIILDADNFVGVEIRKYTE